MTEIKVGGGVNKGLKFKKNTFVISCKQKHIIKSVSSTTNEMVSIPLLVKAYLDTQVSIAASIHNVSNEASEIKQSDWLTWYKSIMHLGLVSYVFIHLWPVAFSVQITYLLQLWYMTNTYDMLNLII